MNDARSNENGNAGNSFVAFHLYKTLIIEKVHNNSHYYVGTKKMPTKYTQPYIQTNMSHVALQSTQSRYATVHISCVTQKHWA